MPNKYFDNVEWWNGVKAVICDFCRTAQAIDDPKAMAFDCSIFPGEGFQVETDEEKSRVFDADDLCDSCTLALKTAFEAVKKERSEPRIGKALKRRKRG